MTSIQALESGAIIMDLGLVIFSYYFAGHCCAYVCANIVSVWFGQALGHVPRSRALRALEPGNNARGLDRTIR